MKPRITAESSTIITENGMPLNPRCFLRRLVVNQLFFDSAGFSNPHPARGEVQSSGPRDLAAHRLGGNQNARLPKNLARRQIIALANLENPLAIEHSRAPGQPHNHSLRLGPVSSHGLE